MAPQHGMAKVAKYDSYTYNCNNFYDIYYLTVLKFYFKLVNNNLPHYLSSFTPQLSAEQQNYNLRNPTMQFPRIKHKFPKQLLC